MKIVIAGGVGAMAWPAAIYLLEQPDVTEILLIDLSESALKERVNKLGGDRRLKYQALDLMADIKATAKAFEGYDVIYNCAFMTAGTATTKAALEAGVSYLDLGGFKKDEQFALHDEFKNKGLLAILGMGTAPGMSSIMAAYGVQQLDKPESIEIKDACVDMVPDTEHSHPLYWGYAIEGIIEEFVMEHPYFVDGEMTTAPARSHPEWIDFRPPAGKVMVATTPHTENVSLPQTFKALGLKHASWKIGFDVDFEEKMTFLRELGLFKTEPVEVDGVKVSPRALMLKLLHNQPPETKKAPDFRGHMIVVVKGEQGGQKVEYTITEYASADLTAKMRERGVFSSYRTGIYGGIAAMMVARGQIEKRGVLYPEACVPPELFLKEAVKAGIEVDVSRKG